MRILITCTQGLLLRLYNETKTFFRSLLASCVVKLLTIVTTSVDTSERLSRGVLRYTTIATSVLTITKTAQQEKTQQLYDQTHYFSVSCRGLLKVNPIALTLKVLFGRVHRRRFSHRPGRRGHAATGFTILLKLLLLIIITDFERCFQLPQRFL